MDDSVDFESLRKVIFLRKVLWNLKLKKCFWLTVITETWLRPQVGYERKVRLEGEKIYTMITRAAQPALFGTATKKLSILLETQMFISQSELVLREVPTPCNPRSNQCLPLLVSSKRMMRIVDSSGLNWAL